MSSASAMYIAHNYKHSINPNSTLERTQLHEHSYTAVQTRVASGQLKTLVQGMSDCGTSPCGAHYASDLSKDYLDKQFVSPWRL